MNKKDIQSKSAIWEVLGDLLNDTNLVSDYKLNTEDFPERFHQIISETINELYEQGYKTIDETVIENYLKEYKPVDYRTYKINEGNKYIDRVKQLALGNNLIPCFQTIKKYTLLRNMFDNGIDISYFFDSDEVDPDVRDAQMSRLSNYTLSQMMDYFNNRTNDITNDFNKYTNNFTISDVDTIPGSDIEYEPIIDDFMLENTLNSIVAPSKAGKSQLAYQMAFCIQNGIPFLNKNTHQCDVLYIDYELRPNAIKSRFEKLCEWFDLKETKKFKVAIPPVGTDLDKVIKLVKAYKEENPNFKVLFLDCYYRFAVGDANSEEDQMKTLSKLKSITELGIAVNYVHHMNKTVSGSRRQDIINNAINASSGTGAHGKIVDETYVIAPDRVGGSGIIINTGRDWSNDIITYRKDESTYWFFQYDADRDSEITDSKTPEEVKQAHPDIWEFLGTEGRNKKTVTTHFKVTEKQLNEFGFIRDKQTSRYKRPCLGNQR